MLSDERNAYVLFLISSPIMRKIDQTLSKVGRVVAMWGLPSDDPTNVLQEDITKKLHSKNGDNVQWRHPWDQGNLVQFSSEGILSPFGSSS